MTVNKKGNYKYNGQIPEMGGDIHRGQDMIRDHWFNQDRIGKVLKDLGEEIPIIISGGEVTQGTGDTLNITACIGYHKYQIEIPDSFASIPPTKMNADVDAIRVESDQQTNMAISSATLNGSAVNYVKLRYIETNGNTRQRAKKIGIYSYELIPSFQFVVDTVAPTEYEICLKSFVGTVGGSFIFSDVATKRRPIFSTDATFASNSDLKYPSEKAIKNNVDLSFNAVKRNLFINSLYQFVAFGNLSSAPDSGSDSTFIQGSFTLGTLQNLAGSKYKFDTLGGYSTITDYTFNDAMTFEFDGFVIGCGWISPNSNIYKWIDFYNPATRILQNNTDQIQLMLKYGEVLFGCTKSVNTGGIKKSVDYGVTWTPVYLSGISITYQYCKTILLNNGITRIIFWNTTNVLYWSDDGGNNWNTYAPTLSGTLNNIFYIDGTFVYICSGVVSTTIVGYFYNTSELNIAPTIVNNAVGGDNWGTAPQSSLCTEYLGVIVILRRAYATATSRKLSYSMDKGKTWYTPFDTGSYYSRFTMYKGCILLYNNTGYLWNQLYPQ